MKQETMFTAHTAQSDADRKRDGYVAIEKALAAHQQVEKVYGADHPLAKQAFALVYALTNAYHQRNPTK
jgi:hypothetical protein